MIDDVLIKFLHLLRKNQIAVFIGYVNIDIRFSTLFFIAAKISGAEGKTEKKQ